MADPSKPAVPVGLVGRFRQRLFPSRPTDEAASTESAGKQTLSRSSLTLRAGFAELLLITRLKARSKPQASCKTNEILERATQIVFVTCNNWFFEADGKSSQRRKPL